jgi:hypothetical protein
VPPPLCFAVQYTLIISRDDIPRDFIRRTFATRLVRATPSDESMTLFIESAYKQDRLSQLAKLDTLYKELLSHTGIRLTLVEEEEEVEARRSLFNPGPDWEKGPLG